MTKKIVPVTALMLLSLSLNAQNFESMEKSPINDSLQTTGLLVCKLTGPEMQARKAQLQKEVFDEAKQIELNDQGLTLSFDDRGDILIKVADYMIAEHECCPFLDFNLRVDVKQKLIEWKVEGPPGTREFLETMMSGIKY